VSHIPVIDNASRREQVREAMVLYRRRRKRGLYFRSILATKDQLDQLEVRGYLDPDRRGQRIDELRRFSWMRWQRPDRAASRSPSLAP